MKKIFFSFGAVMLLASFTNHPTQTKVEKTTIATVKVNHGRGLSAELRGTPGARGGDVNGHGYALMDVNVGQSTLTYFMEVYLADKATAANLHYGPNGTDGPAIAALHAPFTGATQGVASLDKTVIKMMQQHPEDFYISVSNETYPGGAIRGYLSK